MITLKTLLYEIFSDKIGHVQEKLPHYNVSSTDGISQNVLNDTWDDLGSTATLLSISSYTSCGFQAFLADILAQHCLSPS